MGYYTHFTLKVTGPDNPGKPPCPTCGHGGEEAFDPIEALQKQSEGAQYALDDTGGTYESCKWYEWKEDLIAFSKEHPDFLFELSGEGEESGDIWKAYFKNGKVQVEKAEITFAPFDESKLKMKTYCDSCGAKLKPLVSSWYCPNDCDRKPEVRSSKFLVDDLVRVRDDAKLTYLRGVVARFRQYSSHPAGFDCIIMEDDGSANLWWAKTEDLEWA